MLLKDLEAEALLADKAYDADGRVIELLVTQGKTVVIPPSATRAELSVVENRE